LNVAGRPTYGDQCWEQQSRKQRDQADDGEKFEKRNASPS
jgi:hypothetical protein